MPGNQSCIYCSELVKVKDNNFCCNYCYRFAHFSCKPDNHNFLDHSNQWLCYSCNINSSLPFNHLINNDDFIGVIHDLDSTKFHIDIEDIEDHDHLIFNPLRLEDEFEAEELRFESTCNSSYFTSDSCNAYMKTKGECKFSMFHININSMNKNFDELNRLLQSIDQHFSIIAVTETHLKCTPPDYFNLTGYQFVYKNRETKSKGGVGMYISNDISFKIRADLNDNYAI